MITLLPLIQGTPKISVGVLLCLCVGVPISVIRWIEENEWLIIILGYCKSAHILTECSVLTPVQYSTYTWEECRGQSTVQGLVQSTVHLGAVPNSASRGSFQYLPEKECKCGDKAHR